MQRDWEIIRKILLKIEKMPPNVDALFSKDFNIEQDGFDDQIASFHMGLLVNAGLIEGEYTDLVPSRSQCYALRMTWKGHEFLDTIKPENAWEKIKVKAKKDGLGLTFDVIFALAKLLFPKSS